MKIPAFPFDRFVYKPKSDIGKWVAVVILLMWRFVAARLMGMFLTRFFPKVLTWTLAIVAAFTMLFVLTAIVYAAVFAVEWVIMAIYRKEIKSSANVARDRLNELFRKEKVSVQA